MEILTKIKGWAGALTEVGVSLLSLGIILEVPIAYTDYVVNMFLKVFSLLSKKWKFRYVPPICKFSLHVSL